MNEREFLASVVEYVETTDSLIGGLRKKAAASERPAFSDDALSKTAQVLVEADLLSPRASKALIQSFRESPDRALESLRKVASRRVAPRRGDDEIGKPATRAKSRVTDNSVKESDRQFMKDFRL